jgi:hypothetical protein
MKNIKRFENYFDGGLNPHQSKVIGSFDDALKGKLGIEVPVGLGKTGFNVNKMDELEETGSYTLQIDGDHTCSLEDFIQDNTGTDVEPLSDEDIQAVSNLEVGEEYNIGIGGGYSTVKRIA